MNFSIFLVSVLAQVSPSQSTQPTSPGSAIELAIWKWVVIIGVGAVVLLYLAKRVAEVVVKKKTDTMIREVVGEDADKEPTGDWKELDDLDKSN